MYKLQDILKRSISIQIYFFTVIFTDNNRIVVMKYLIKNLHIQSLINYQAVSAG